MDRFLLKTPTSKISRDAEVIDAELQHEDETVESQLSNELNEVIHENYELNTDEPQMPQTNKRRVRKYTNKFSDSWLDHPEFKQWLSKSKHSEQNFAYCSVCKTKIVSHKSGIIRHSKSNKHRFNFSQISISNKITELYKITPLKENVRKAELKLSGMLATNNLPFVLMDTLAPLCKNIFPDSEIARKLSLKRTKATTLITKNLGQTFLNNLYDILRTPGCFFSVIMDETTDIGSKKQCAFTVIYYDSQQDKIATKFLDMVEVTSSTAVGLYSLLKDVIVSKQIPLSNFVGFASDTTNVMVGQNNSVFSLLKSELCDIICVKCSCHMIHLSASKACLKLPRSVEDLLRNIGSHFNRSHLRQEKFREFQHFFKTDIHKILSRATTRWLSLKQCTDRVLEQYGPLKAYLRELTFSDPSITNDEMLKTIENRFTVIYLEFMSYTLEILNDFNVMFQSETPLLYKLKPEIEKLLKIICSNFLEIIHIQNKDTNVFTMNHTDPRKFVPLEKIYIGIQASESFQELKKEPNIAKIDIETFLKSCLNFYLELVTDIKARFDFTDKIFEIIKVVEPKFAYSFEKKSLKEVIDRFPILKNFVDIQALDNEWKRHALLNLEELNINLSCGADKYWSQIFALKNASGVELFGNLKIIIHFLLILPFSNASVERIFSELKNIKTDHRNSLNTDTIKAILATKQGIENIIEFNPKKCMIHSNIWTEKK